MIMRRIVRILPILIFVLGQPSAQALTPEEAYMEARDAAIAKIKAAVTAEARGPKDSYSDRILTADKQALADLEKQMRGVIGPVSIHDLGGTGVLNLDTLVEGDQGFGLLDGMVYGAVGAKTRVIVTTDGLLRRWLREHKNWWGKDSADLPQEPEAAIKEDGFYTQAISTDAAIMRFAELPVRKPAAASFAFAMLGARSQSDAPAKADEIFLAVAQSGRVFVAHTRAFAAVGPIASCDAVRKDLVTKSIAAAAERGLDDEQRRQKSDALSAKAEAEFLRCFAERARQENNFAAATAAAQALIEQVPAR
jgi:hypothetical protein